GRWAGACARGTVRERGDSPDGTGAAPFRGPATTVCRGRGRASDPRRRHMSRLPAPSRDELAPEHQALWDRIGAARSGTVSGPFSVLIRVPALAEAVDGVSAYFRDDVTLPKPDLELGALTAVRETGARFAWNRHEAAGKRVGTRPEAIEAVRAQGALDGLTPRERLVVEIVRSLLRTRTLSDELFA